MKPRLPSIARVFFPLSFICSERDDFFNEPARRFRSERRRYSRSQSEIDERRPRRTGGRGNWNDGRDGRDGKTMSRRVRCLQLVSLTILITTMLPINFPKRTDTGTFVPRNTVLRVARMYVCRAIKSNESPLRVSFTFSARNTKSGSSQMRDAAGKRVKYGRAGRRDAGGKKRPSNWNSRGTREKTKTAGKLPASGDGAKLKIEICKSNSATSPRRGSGESLSGLGSARG